ILSMFACSKNNITPEERLKEYTTFWTEQQFDSMYSMLTDEAKTEYPTEEFVDRYQKIYEDINVSDLSISFPELTKEELKEASENKSIDIPLTVEFNSIAGEINFSYDIELIQVEEEDKLNWKIDWNPGLIFPDLVDGGEIRIQMKQPRRGEILDRNRMPLAINDIVYEVGIVPERFENKKEEISQTATLLGMSTSSIEEQLNAEWVEPHLFVPLKK